MAQHCRKHALITLAATAFLLMARLGASADVEGVECSPTADKPCIVTATGLPFRLLVKPQSNVYAQMNEGSAQVRPNVPPFEVYYAFAQSDVSYDENFDAKGWFQVGAKLDEPPAGYMRATDVVPWKQALAIAFKNPGNGERKPVLMFKSSQALDDTLAKIEGGTLKAEDLYQDVIVKKKVPEGIVSREPDGWIDIDKTFYLMPILDFAHVPSSAPSDDLESVRLAALTNQSRSKQEASAACDLRKSGADKCVQEHSGNFKGVKGMNVVFVIDMTASMQPNIDAVRNAVRDASRALSANFTDSGSKLRFGLVGYRDDVEVSPGLEFDTKNFTPELLDPAGFAKLLESGVAKAADAGSGEWAEDVFAGMKTGLESAWDPDLPKIMILIGDASGHPVGDPKNSLNLDERQIKDKAKEKSVYIASIYVVGPNSPTDDFDKAKPQFETMASGDGENVSFSKVTGSGETSLEVSLRDQIDNIVKVLGTGDFKAIMSDATASTDATGQAIAGAVRAAMVDYIGNEAQPPTNLVAWALDADPTDYKKKAFDIKLMVSRKDVEELKDLLKGLLENLQSGKATGTFTFMGAQAGSTAASYDLGIAATDKLASSKAVPTYIKNLPYKSDILTLSLEEFQNASPDDRQKFEERLNSLTVLYDDVLNRADRWVILNQDGKPDDQVYMLDLSNLP